MQSQRPFVLALVAVLLAVLGCQGGVRAYVADATPYESVLGHAGANRPVDPTGIVPAGYHVQLSYARDASVKTSPYTYGLPVRAENLAATPRAPTLIQPEVAFVPDAASAAPPSADDVPVYSNTAIPAPAQPASGAAGAAAGFVSFADAGAGADAEADAEAEADVSSEVSLSALDEHVADAAEFALQLEEALADGDAAALKQQQQEDAFRQMRAGAGAGAGVDEFTIKQSSFVETGVDAGAGAGAAADAELDAEVAEDLDLEEEGSDDAPHAQGGESFLEVSVAGVDALDMAELELEAELEA